MRLKTILTASLVFVFSLTVAVLSILQNIQMLRLKQTLVKKANYYAQLKSENSRLKLQVEKMANFGRLKELAESKGMRFPKKDELVKIVVILDNPEKQKKSKSVLDKIEESFKAYAIEKSRNPENQVP